MSIPLRKEVNRKSMAFLLSNIGLLSQMAGHGSHGPKGIDPSAQSTNPYGASFGTVLGGQMNAPSASDPLAQLTFIVQNGTPISTVVDRLASLVSQRAGSQAGTVAKSIKSALSPPSQAPPGTTAAQQVAALARRLQTWIGGVAGGADQRVGQQSDTSGQVLDANRARELPAHTDPESASSTLDVSALARSLLAQVAASFGPVQGAQAAVSAFSEAAKASTGLASTLARQQNAAAPTAQLAAADAPGPEQSDAATLLARMLSRAASVDAQVNGNAMASQTSQIRASNTTGTVPHGEGVNFSQTAAAARLEAALGDVIATSAQNHGGNASTDGQGAGSSFRDASSLPGSAPATSKAAPAATSDTLAFTVPTASPSQSFAQSASSSAYGSSVDPSAIVEQVIRSMAMRTQSDGTSEVRMRLVPEHLGGITLSLKVDGSNVSATAVAQNADVRNALVAHQQQLARSLADSGLKLTSFSVNLSGGSAGQDQPRDRTSGFGRQYAVHEVTAARQTDSTESTTVEPAIVPQSTLALFSYLA